MLISEYSFTPFFLFTLWGIGINRFITHSLIHSVIPLLYSRCKENLGKWDPPFEEGIPSCWGQLRAFPAAWSTLFSASSQAIPADCQIGVPIETSLQITHLQEEEKQSQTNPHPPFPQGHWSGGVAKSLWHRSQEPWGVTPPQHILLSPTFPSPGLQGPWCHKESPWIRRIQSPGHRAIHSPLPLSTGISP